MLRSNAGLDHKLGFVWTQEGRHKSRKWEDGKAKTQCYNAERDQLGLIHYLEPTTANWRISAGLIGGVFDTQANQPRFGEGCLYRVAVSSIIYFLEISSRKGDKD